MLSFVVIIKEIEINRCTLWLGECGCMYAWTKYMKITFYFANIRIYQFLLISPLHGRDTNCRIYTISDGREGTYWSIIYIYIKYIFAPYLSNYLIVSQFDWQFLSLLPFFSIFVFDAHIQSLPRSSSTFEFDRAKLPLP